MLVKISDIVVKKRIRKDLGDLDALKESLKLYGLLNPITINSNSELVAGERRLEAAKALGWDRIAAVVLDKNTDRQKELEIELEENNQRKEFTDEELMEGYVRLEKLRNPPFWIKFFRFMKEIFKGFLKLIKKIHSDSKKKKTAPGKK